MSPNGNGKTQIMIVQVTMEVPAVTTDAGKKAQAEALTKAAESGFQPLGKIAGMYMKTLIMERQVDASTS